MYENFLSTYSDKKSCHTSTTLQTSIARFVSDSWASCSHMGWAKTTVQYEVFCNFFPNGWDFLKQNKKKITRQLYVYTYGKLQNFIQLSLNLTLVCHIKCNHPVNFHFSLYRLHRKVWMSTKFTTLGYHVWGAMLQAFHKLHSKLETIPELKMHRSRCGMTCRRLRSTKLLTTFGKVWTHAPWPVVDILNIRSELYTEIFWLNSVCCFRRNVINCVLTRCLSSNSKNSC